MVKFTNIMAKESIIVSLGGSLVAPDGIDVAFLKVFRNSIKKQLDKNRFFIFVGGGGVCRNYQQAMQEFGADSNERDLIGIDVSRLNAKVVQQLFGELAFSEVITNPSKKVTTNKGIVVAGGWKPGWSTDYCAVTLAKNMGIKTIINLSNIDYVCDKDPRRFKNVKAFKEIPWKDFRKMVGNKWVPGMHVPFDPQASKEAEILKIKVVIVNGKKLDRMENFLKGKEFIGTTIQ